MISYKQAKDRLLGLQATADAFLPYNAKEIAEGMQLVARGKEKAAQNLPAIESELLDDVEQEIVNRIEIAVSQADQHLKSQLSTYAQRLEEVTSSGEAADIRTIARQAVASFSMTVREAQSDLFIYQRKVFERRRDLSNFREENSLIRSADYPSHYWTIIAIIAGLFLIETVPNAFFLGENSRQGVLGGWTKSIVFSFLNLGLGFLTGFFAIRLICHNKKLLKITGVSLSGVLIAVIVALNLALAHFRTASESMLETEAARLALEKTFSSSAFLIDDLISAAMVGIGIIFAFVTMYEGYRCDDPYPKYGKVWRRRDYSERIYTRVAASKLSQLRYEQHQYVDGIKISRSRLRDRREVLPSILQERRRLVMSFDLYLSHLEQVGQALMSIYRESNRGNRKKVPARFNKAWQLSNRPQSINLDDEMWKIPESDIKEIDQALEESIERLHSSLDEAILWIKHVGEIKEQDDYLEEDGNAEAIQRKAA